MNIRTRDPPKGKWWRKVSTEFHPTFTTAGEDPPQIYSPSWRSGCSDKEGVVSSLVSPEGYSGMCTQLSLFYVTSFPSPGPEDSRSPRPRSRIRGRPRARYIWWRRITTSWRSIRVEIPNHPIFRGLCTVRRVPCTTTHRVLIETEMIPGRL